MQTHIFARYARRKLEGILLYKVVTKSKTCSSAVREGMHFLHAFCRNALFHGKYTWETHHPFKRVRRMTFIRVENALFPITTRFIFFLRALYYAVMHVCDGVAIACPIEKSAVNTFVHIHVIVPFAMGTRVRNILLFHHGLSYSCSTS